MKQEPSGWEAIRQRVLKRDNYECRFCGVSDDAHTEEHEQGLDVHHVIPRRDGGNDTPRNLAALCRSCHRTMETLHAQAVGEHVTDDYHDDLANINRIYRSGWERVDAIDRKLGDFIEKHPTFRNEFFIYDEESREEKTTIECDAWKDIVYPNGRLEIDSEFAFAVAYGVKKTLAQTFGEVDGRTAVPFDVEGEEK